MNSSINMDRLIQNLDTKLEKMNNTNQTYVSLDNKYVDEKYSNLEKKVEKPPKFVEKKQVVKEEKNVIDMIKKYLIIYIIFVLLSHPEFDKITNIENVPLIYRIMIKALVMIIIQLILSSVL